MKFNGFVGPTYSLKSVNVDCQRCVNLYPEIIESGTGKEGATVYLKSTPGLTKLFECGTGPIRLVLVDDPAVSLLNPTNRIFVASGAEMYKASFDGTTWTVELLGDLATATGPVSGVAMRGDLGSAVFVDGVHSYAYWKYDDGDGLAIEAFGEFSDFGYIEVPNATHVVWIDGFFIFNEGGSGRFWVSEWGSLNVAPLSFATSEGDPDALLAMISNNRDLILSNARTTEVWANTGNADFPFERIQGGFVEKGIVAPNTLKKIDGFVFWVGRDVSGQGIIYAAQGLTPQRISTHAVEYAISTYADISNATAYTYQKEGHSFYVLNFDEGTWVFDLSTKMWHERAYTNDGILERHRADNLSFFPEYNLHLVGDYESNEVYALDSNVYQDDGDAITRMRTSPHVSGSLKRVFYNSLELDMETGIGLDGDVQGSDPQVMLQFSNDGGHTWSSESWTSAGVKVGGIGNFKKRVIWRRLGSARDRVFKIVITDPVPVTIIGAELDLVGGVS